MTCSGVFRANLPPSTWENLLPSKPGTSLLHFPIFLLLPLVTNLLPLDANSPTSHNSSLTPLHKFQAPTLLLHQMLYLGHLLRQLLLIHQLLRLLVLPPLQNLPTPSSPQGLPCSHTVLKLSLSPQGLLCGHHYTTSTIQFSPSNLECLIVTMRLYMELMGTVREYLEHFMDIWRIHEKPQSPQYIMIVVCLYQCLTCLSVCVFIFV